jgi:hypothetical protein
MTTSTQPQMVWEVLSPTKAVPAIPPWCLPSSNWGEIDTIHLCNSPKSALILRTPSPAPLNWRPEQSPPSRSDHSCRAMWMQLGATTGVGAQMVLEAELEGDSLG